MASDITLDEDGDGWVTVQSEVLKTSAHDVMIDNPARHTKGGRFRRALVHNENDGLTVNFAGDYPGGVQVEGDVSVGGAVRAGSLRLRVVDAAPDALPHTGEVGELILVRDTRIDTTALLPDVSLWVCLGPQTQTPLPGIDPDDTVFWARVRTDPPVAGSGV